METLSFKLKSLKEASYIYAGTANNTIILKFKNRLVKFILKNKDVIDDKQLLEMNYDMFQEIAKKKLDTNNRAFLIRALLLSGAGRRYLSIEWALRPFKLARGLEQTTINAIFSKYGKYFSKEIFNTVNERLDVYVKVRKEMEKLSLESEKFPKIMDSLMLATQLFDGKDFEHKINLEKSIESLINTIDEKNLTKGDYIKNLEKILNNHLGAYKPLKPDLSHHYGLPHLVGRLSNLQFHEIYQKEKKQKLAENAINILKIFLKIFDRGYIEKTTALNLGHLEKWKENTLGREMYYMIIVPETKLNKPANKI